MFEKVGIVFNQNKREAVEMAEGIHKWLCQHNIQIYFLRSHLENLANPSNGISSDNLASNCDFIISLGGDGTLLYTARMVASHETPILGVNFGHFGFLAAVERNNVYDCLEKVLADDYSIDKRIMLNSTVYRNGEVVDESYALNDVVINKGGFSRSIKLETFVSGQYVSNYSGDGFIISSPTGSTAYTLSAGGPIVSPEVKAIILTPICPHVLFTRPLIISSSEQVRVVLKTDGPGTVLTIDGQYGFSLCKGDQIIVKAAPFETKLIRLNGQSFYEKLHFKIYKR